MSNWIGTEEPMGTISLARMLNILKALALTDCDPHTLEVVALATELGDYWPPAPARVVVGGNAYGPHASEQPAQLLLTEARQ